MEFTASDGRVILEDRIFRILSTTIKNLKYDHYAITFIWEEEFIEWYLDKDLRCEEEKNELSEIKLYQHITEDELEQLEQLIDYLEL